MKKLFVIDVSGYIFRAFHALPPMKNAEGLGVQGLFGFVRAILKLCKDFSPTHAVAVFDGPDNKRKRAALYPAYKATRDKAPEELPYQIDQARIFCELLGLSTLTQEGVEADDTMASVAMWAAAQGTEVLLCTADKDLYQCVGPHVQILQTHKENLLIDQAKVKELMGVLPEQVIDYLAIIGDASDNVPGVRGLGPKSASDLLNEWTTLSNLYANLDKLSGKKQQLLQEHRELAFLSQKLVTVETDLEVPHDEAFYEIKEATTDGLQAFYQQMSFRSLIEEKKKPAVEGHYEVATDPEQFLEILLKAPIVAFDCETTGLDVVSSTLIGVGLSWVAGKGIYVTAEKIGFLKRLFAERSLPWVAHNGKFDLHALKTAEIAVTAPLFDTMLCSYLLFSEQRQHSLDSLSERFLGRHKGSYQELVGKGTLLDVPVEKVAEYCCLDADLTLQLYEILQKKIEERGLQSLLKDIELPLLEVLFEMEERGIFIDEKRLEEVGRQVAHELAAVQKIIFETAGEAFNLNSPRQLADILFDKLAIPSLKKTTGGQRSTSADILEELSASYPIAETILQYRSLEKLRSTYIETLPSYVNKKSRRIHPSFNQSVAATGRLSCQEPNLQNIPVRTELGRAIRSAFRPEQDHWLFLSADYSQIELRMLAHMSEDPVLMRAFEHDEDVHAYTASQIFNCALDQVTSEQRRMAKVVNFGIIYGQQAFGLSRELKCSMKEAALFIDLYFARYARVKEFLYDCKEKAKKSGYAVTMTGREREIPDINSRNKTLQAAAERLAINTPLQGSAADLIKMAMIRAEKLIRQKKLKSFMILQIHDELLFEMDPQEADRLLPLVQEAMQTVMSLKVPLKTDIAIGKNWKECYA